MALKLIHAEMKHREQISEMLDEWKKDITENHTDGSPWAIFKNDWHDFEYYLARLETKENDPNDWVPDSVLFCLDEERDRFVGAVNIRHRLNARLLESGGHIGDGIRPSERRKGYATRMIALALEECRALGITRVLMCCDQDNIASEKTIMKNGGVFENEIRSEDGVTKRFWITLE